MAKLVTKIAKIAKKNRLVNLTVFYQYKAETTLVMLKIIVPN